MQLKRFAVSDNNLTGPLPESWGNLSQASTQPHRHALHQAPDGVLYTLVSV